MRVSATQLESFRLFMAEDWMTEAMLIESLTGVFVPNEAIKLGHAYHRVLELPDEHRIAGGDGYACEGFTFDRATMDPMLCLIDRRGVFEVKTTKQIGPITLVAQADQLCGARLTEFKTTEQFRPEKYLDSAQWRVMAWLFEPLAITYRVAVLDNLGGGQVALKALEELTVYPYDGLVADCQELVGQFVAFVEAKGLAGALREKQAQRAMEEARVA